MNSHKPTYYIRIQKAQVVQDPTTLKPSHVLYHFECRLNTPKPHTFSKRYSELLHFHKELLREASNHGIAVATNLNQWLHFPPKMFLGNFKVRLLKNFNFKKLDVLIFNDGGLE